VFVVFGAGKFANHGAELASFRTYDVPAPEVFVLLIGVVELLGGALLIAGLLTRPAALVLAGDMAGAIVVSGIAKGEAVSLTVAPAELVLMLLLLWQGPGAYVLRRKPAGARPPGRPDDRPQGRRAERGPSTRTRP
jgi:putative oxidoreductase